MKQCRGIRRFVIRTGIFLLLGAIVNIVVAWGCALTSQPDVDSLSRQIDFMLAPRRASDCLNSDDSAWILAHGWQETGELGGQERRFSLVPGPVLVGFGMRLQTVDELVLSTPGILSLWDREVAQFSDAGWPVLALNCRAWNTAIRDLPSVKTWLVVWGVDVLHRPQTLIAYRRLPLRPLWLGFAINTLFYAAILWLLFAGSGALRRRRRLKRGLCPACAYPVGTSDLCTECGMPIPLSLRERVRVRTQTS